MVGKYIWISYLSSSSAQKHDQSRTHPDESVQKMNPPAAYSQRSSQLPLQESDATTALTPPPPFQRSSMCDNRWWVTKKGKEREGNTFSFTCLSMGIRMCYSLGEKRLCEELGSEIPSKMNFLKISSVAASFQHVICWRPRTLGEKQKPRKESMSR